MQIPGFPFDIYSLLGFASIVFIVYLGLVQVFNPTDANERARLERVVRDANDVLDQYIDQHQVPSTFDICLFCKNGRAYIRCPRCKVAGYCSGECQIKHWRASHKLECKPADVDSTPDVSSEGISTSDTDISSSTSGISSEGDVNSGTNTNDMDISSSNHQGGRDQLPSPSVGPYVCLVCLDDKADIRCARCKVARYCSRFCQMKHHRAGHPLECKPADVVSAFAVSSKGISTIDTDISSSGRLRDRNQMPSTSASPDKCLFCGNGRANKCCVRCKVARYCSAACQVKHWRAVHRLECKEYKSPASLDTASASKRRGASPHNCFVCGVWAKNRCSRCKAVRYCSGTCQIKHWNEGHMLECEEFKSPAAVDYLPNISSERRCLDHMCRRRSSSDHLSDRDQMASISASPNVCSVCDDLADTHCSGCDVKYCSQKCLIKHWRAGHWLECKKYKSPGMWIKIRSSNHVDISSSGYLKDQHQVPSAPASQDFCFVCSDWSNIHCSRCKVVSYCSQACETKHWREGHELECKVDKSPANVYSASGVCSERRGPGHMCTPSSEYQHSKKDGKLNDTVQSPNSTSSKVLPIVEECPICFSTVHTGPSCPFLTCEICKHKFHSTCLLKWFSTSKKLQCPLCQSPFKSEGPAV